MISNLPAFDVTQTKIKPFSIAWLFPNASLVTDPSARLRRFQISQYFNTLYNVVIKSDNFFFYDKIPNLPDELSCYDVVVMFSVNELEKDLCKFLKSKNIITIFDHCENIFGLGMEDEIMSKSSAITCCSTYLARSTFSYLISKFNCNKPIFVIRDPIEDSTLNFRPMAAYNPNTALVMGMGANVQYVFSKVERACQDAGYKILILTESGFQFPGHTVEYWTPYTWMEHVSKCSVAICCHDQDKFPAKGNVKVTTPMSLGVPVVASPIDAYREAVIGSQGGFIAEKEEDWLRYLTVLKDSDERNFRGLKARQYAIANYRTEKIALDYLSMISYLKSN